MATPEQHESAVEVILTNYSKYGLHRVSSPTEYSALAYGRPAGDIDKAEVDKQGLDKERLGMDVSQAPLISTETNASVLEGLAFDPKRFRSEAFYLLDTKKEIPVAVITIGIAPKEWLERQRFYAINDGEVQMVGLEDRLPPQEDLPDFTIVLRWTRVHDEYKNQFARKGVRFISETIKLLAEKAPNKTWLMVNAMGKSRLDPFDMERGDFLTEIPFKLENFAKNSKGSASSVKLARLLGMKQIDNLADEKTVGPVFYKLLIKE